MARQLENNFRKRFCELVMETHGPHQYQQKHHGSEFSAGLPDTLFVVQGKTVFIEFKAQDELPLLFNSQPTKLQMHTLGKIRHAMADEYGAYVATYIQDLDILFFAPYLLHRDARARSLAMRSTSPRNRFIYDWKDLRKNPDWFATITYPFTEPDIADTLSTFTP